MMKQQRFIVIKFGLEYLFFRNSVQQNGKYILCTCFLLERMTDNYGYSDLNKSKKSDFPGGSDGEASVYNAGDLDSIPGSGKIPWGRKQQPTPVLLPRKYHGQRTLVDYSPWDHL